MIKYLKPLKDYIVGKFDASSKCAQVSYSQEGEDLILENYFEGRSTGFYVDVGAHHPFRFSNTYSFYKKGWRGINIDATPGSMELFNKYRSKDINIEKAIANRSTKIDYFIFDEPALNSFSSKLSNDRNKNTKYKIKKTIRLSPLKLSEVLDKYIPANIEIDFLSVDVEGYEHEVVTSNNWNKYQPKYLLIEITNVAFEDLTKNKTYQFLKEKKYSAIASTGRTVIFKKK